MGLPSRVYLHAPRLTYLFGAGAGTSAGARALLGASLTRGTSGTSAPPGALSTRPVMSLLSLAGDRGVLFGLTSTFRLAFLRARSWYWRSFWCSFARCLSGIGALHSILSAVGVSGCGALSGAPLTGGVSCSPQLSGNLLSLEALLCCTLTGSRIPEKNENPKTQTTVS